MTKGGESGYDAEEQSVHVEEEDDADDDEFENEGSVYPPCPCHCRGSSSIHSYEADDERVVAENSSNSEIWSLESVIDSSEEENSAGLSEDSFEHDSETPSSNEHSSKHSESEPHEDEVSRRPTDFTVLLFSDHL